jgi:hypothetical protein
MTLNIKEIKQKAVVNIKVDGAEVESDELKQLIPEDFIEWNKTGEILLAEFKERLKLIMLDYELGNISRSFSTARETIFDWFRRTLVDHNRTTPYILTVWQENQQVFEEILRGAIQEYAEAKKKSNREKRVEAIKDSENIFEFEFSKSQLIDDQHYELTEYKKNIYKSCYMRKDRAKTEISFEKFLEKTLKGQNFWGKNGEKRKTDFGIFYENSMGDPSVFYPDYIVWFNGKIGIFEVKSINDADEDTPYKATALQEYISEQKRPELTGGIVMETKTGWRVTCNKKYKKGKGDWGNWEDLKVLLKNNEK